MKIKICGITNLNDALAACEAGADALGFNFAEAAKKRNRHIALGEAREIIRRLPPFITTVAVCVNQQNRVDEFLSIVDRVQFHGDEPPEVCESVGGRAIKAFRPGPGFRVQQMSAYRVGAWLMDTYVAGEPGGTGKVTDWGLARDAVKLGTPLILAGGLTPENVGEAIRAVRPYGVDVAGGVEAQPGKKDHERIRRFIDNARASLS